MQYCVCTPGPPAFRACENLRGARPLASDSQDALESRITGEESVALAETAHGNVLRGPLANSGDLAQPGDGLSQIPAGIEQVRLCPRRRGDAVDAFDPGSGDPQRREACDTESLRPRERMCQGGLPELLTDRLAEHGHQAGAKPGGFPHGDLLTEDGTYGDLEAIPRSGHA